MPGESPRTDGAATDGAATPAETDVLVAGETLVDFVPRTAGPLEDVETFDRRAGGAPANVAVALARLGDPPLFWTRVGDDPFGDFLADRLAAEGVPDRLVERDPGAHTTLAFVGGGDAEPRFSFYRDGTADTRLEGGAVPDETLEAAEWVHAGGVALATEPARSATLDLVERAGRAGCTVSFDPNVRPELWANDAELATVCGWALDAVDVLVATPSELRALGVGGTVGSPGDVNGPEAVGRGCEPEALASAALDRGPHTVVLTLGADGAVAVASTDAPWADAGTGGTRARHGGHDVDAVDPTGAGDAFAAGLVDSLRREPSLPDALAFANAVGALATTARGAMEALPTREEAEALLEG